MRLPFDLLCHHILWNECSGSVVKCLTRDRRAVGSSLSGITVLCPRARHIYPNLVLVQPRKTSPYITERLMMGRKESNQTKTTQSHSVARQSWNMDTRRHLWISLLLHKFASDTKTFIFIKTLHRHFSWRLDLSYRIKNLVHLQI